MNEHYTNSQWQWRNTYGKGNKYYEVIAVQAVCILSNKTTYLGVIYLN